MQTIKFGKESIGDDDAVYFIADIAANHDGDLDRAKMLISLAKDSGADAIKFQNHNCEKYVSDYGFKHLGQKLSHQSKWKKSVYEIYKDAQVPLDWTAELKKHADKENIEYLSTPYDLDMIDILESFVNVYKIGSGDINWDELLIAVAKKNKPVILSSGASTIGEVQHAIETVKQFNDQIILLQCNTNYTADHKNFKYINLNVLRSYKLMYPGVIVGLSDHTHGHATVLGAIALGAKVIEKHFTDDNSRNGPDHPFSMTPATFQEMVLRARELEVALGDFNKSIQENEHDTIILQRRCIRAKRSLAIGETITRSDVEMQRPAPIDSISPNNISLILGRKVTKFIHVGEAVTFDNV
ncbi:MAG: N-acetylneuraminate synthase family protein [Bacteroidales bacterium]|nr:N-acetylneuraminate synthase family protein [Bacteroidales bacterium]